MIDNQLSVTSRQIKRGCNVFNPELGTYKGSGNLYEFYHIMTDTPRGSLNVSSSGIRVTSDTPVKPSATFPMTYGETAQQAVSSIKRSLRGNVRIASPKDFCERFLPVSGHNGLDQALLEVKQKLYDDDQRRWKYFPSGKIECEFYQPFQRIAEAVNEASRVFAPKNAILTTWLDRHSKAPDTMSKDAAAIRPDIVQVSVSTQRDFDELDEQIQQSRTNKASTSRWPLRRIDSL